MPSAYRNDASVNSTFGTWVRKSVIYHPKVSLIHPPRGPPVIMMKEQVVGRSELFSYPIQPQAQTRCV